MKPDDGPLGPTMYLIFKSIVRQ